MKSTALAAILALPLLAACASENPTAEVETGTDQDATVITEGTETAVDQTPAVGEGDADSCNAAQYQELVGQQSPEVSLPSGTEMRHYRTGDPVTADLNPARINFEYDRSGRLVKVTCG